MIMSFIGPYQEEDESNPSPAFLFEIRFNIKLLFTSRSSWWTISFRFFFQNVVCIFLPPSLHLFYHPYSLLIYIYINIYNIYILILNFYLRLGLPGGLLPSDFSFKTSYVFFFLPLYICFIILTLY